MERALLGIEKQMVFSQAFQDLCNVVVMFGRLPLVPLTFSDEVIDAAEV